MITIKSNQSEKKWKQIETIKKCSPEIEVFFMLHYSWLLQNLGRNKKKRGAKSVLDYTWFRELCLFT